MGRGYQIDPDKSRRRKSHPVLVTFFVLITLAIVSAAVWFLGFSEWGFAWEGNTSRSMTEAPAEVVTAYPSVKLTLDDVALIMSPGDSRRLKVKVTDTAPSQHVNRDELIMRWHSENPSVARVNQKGTVKAVGEGTARIVVNVGNTDIDSNTTYCLVTVKAPHTDPNSSDSE